MGTGHKKGNLCLCPNMIFGKVRFKQIVYQINKIIYMYKLKK